MTVEHIKTNIIYKFMEVRTCSCASLRCREFARLTIVLENSPGMVQVVRAPDYEVGDDKKRGEQTAAFIESRMCGFAEGVVGIGAISPLG